MAHAVPKGGDGLPAQNAARRIGDGAADDERQAFAAGLKKLVNREQRGLGIERVKNRLDQQHITTALHQRLHLLKIGRTQLLKAHIARTGVVHIGADTGGFGRGAKCAHHKAGFAWCGKFVARRTCQPGGLQVHLSGQMGHLVVGLGHRGGAKGVGLHQVCTGRQIAFVNVLNHVGAGEGEQLVVALHVAPKIGKALAPVLRFVQLEALDHGAHCAVQNYDALAQNVGQRLGAGVGKWLHALNFRR